MNETENIAENIIAASSVVNYLFDNAKLNNKLTNVHLNKISYFVHGFSLAVHNSPVVNEEYNECIEAWKYGPVIPSIYHEFKKFGNNVITDEHSFIGIESDTNGLKAVKPKPTEQIKRIIDWVVNNMIIDESNTNNIRNADELITLTHTKNSPWEQVYSPYKKHIEISNESIRHYFIWYYDWLVNTKKFTSIV
jgi:uncharacterized phage-associated protein